MAAAGHARDERINHPFERALAAGQYKEADRVAQRDLGEVTVGPDFRSADTVERYLRAAKSADIWARWGEARQLLGTLEKGMQAALPPSSPMWLELHARQVQLYARLSDYGAADAAYGEGRRKALHHRLEATPEFEMLLSVHQESLADQRREWDAIEAAEERLGWLRRHERANALEIGNTLTSLGSLQAALDRHEASAAAFNQALQVLEPAYKAGKPNRHAATEAMKLWADAAYRVRDYEKWDTCQLRKELLGALEKEFGATSTELVAPLVDMASFCEDEMRARDVQALFDRALTIADAAWGPAHPVTLHVLDHQSTYFASREYADAMNERGRRIRARHAELSKQAYADAPAALALMQLYQMSEDFGEHCDRFASNACKARVVGHLATLSRIWGDDHPALAVLRTYVATRLGGFTSSAATQADDAARYAFVDELCDAALNAAVSRMGPGHPQTGRVAKECAEHAARVGNHERAARLQTQALRIYAKRFGEKDDATRGVAEDLDRSRLILKK